MYCTTCNVYFGHKNILTKDKKKRQYNFEFEGLSRYNNPVMTTYTCPMHPEIVSDKPGHCPKCSMALVVQETKKPAVHVPHDDKGLGKLTWNNYLPLIVIVALITLASVVIATQSSESFKSFVITFMTGFFLVFGGFKLMDLKGFAEGYSTYDLLAQRWFFYGYLYPFIELTFGFLMLAGYHPDWLLWTEFGVMMFGGIGVAIKLWKREPFICACLGTFLKVPLTYITLIENFGMALLAITLIVLG